MAEQFKSGSAPGSRRPLFFANIERNSSEFSHPSMSYNFWMFSVFALARIAGTKSVGSGNFSALTTDFRTSSVSESPVSNTIPGQSIRKIRFINVIYCQTFVSPGIGATLQTFFVLMVFMREDLPTFGYPTIPTLICFFVRMQLGKLSEEIYQRAFAEGVRYRGVEGDRGHFFAQKADPLFGGPIRHEIHFVYHKDQMFVGRVFGQMFFQMLTPCSWDISGIQNLNDNIRAVDHFVQLVPNPLRLPFVEQRVFFLDYVVKFSRYVCVFLAVPVSFLIVLSFVQQRRQVLNPNFWSFPCFFFSKNIGK
mmetsp:Transcript_17689/g.25054  ORF Transcript_17689/g.25054 Transcript_17689/m.25054 type:complete len:307 (+) Transcript_17689:386-1306(+)